jgi:hypothetical protein
MKDTTPGPWRWGDWSAHFGDLEDPRKRRTLERNAAHPGEIADVVRTERDGALWVARIESREEIKDGDAELIRHAPELRDALAEMLRDFGGSMDSARFRELRALVGDPVED